VTNTTTTWQATVDELSEALAAEFPDPVDVFEDELVRQLGLERHPSCPLPAWRAVRLRFLDAVE